ncbi:MAG: TylF/MycF/NovP-related O-methyltransferase [Bacteroidota bacterium]
MTTKKQNLRMIGRIKKYIRKNKSARENTLVDVTDDDFWEIYEICKPYTMTSLERMYGLYEAVKYILRNNIKGDFVECGVWRGGSAMLIGEVLARQKVSDRKIFLYDTFEGMSPPTSSDVDLNGNSATSLLEANLNDRADTVWCEAPLEQVKQNMQSCGLSDTQVVYVKGEVENTIPNIIPDAISLLRLDTDWYESTSHELLYLYPKLSIGGVLIVDDYGHWQGCQKAVDEYFKTLKFPPLLNRLDYTGRMAIKYRDEVC